MKNSVPLISESRLMAVLLCLLLVGPALAWPHAADQNGTAPDNRQDPKKARLLYEEAIKAQHADDWPKALDLFSQAVTYAPGVPAYTFYRDVARSRVVRTLADHAERSAVLGLLDQAQEDLRAALEIDPGDSIVRERLMQLGRAQQPAAPQETPEDLASEIRLQPQPGTHNFDFRGDTRAAYEELAKQFGVSVALDVDLPARPVRLHAEDLDFDTAARLLGDMTGTFWKPLTSRLFFVAQDNPQKRRDYDLSTIRTVVLPASASTDQMTETQRVVRDISGISRADLNTASRTLTLRATPHALNVAVQLVDALEQAPAEVILEIELLEVNRNVARQLGITPPQSAKIFSISRQQLQIAEQSVQGLINVITQIFGQPSAAGNLSGTQISSLVGGGQLSASSLIPPILAFGGGATTFFYTLSGAAVNFSNALSLVRSGQRVLLRAEDGQMASFFVGDRVPVSLASFSASEGSSTFIPGVSSSTFPITDFTTGIAPVAVTAGDFNGDGIQDLAVVNQTDNTVSILLGNGDGTFGAKTDFPVGHGPIAIATSDFNGDGHADLAVVNQTDNTISILLGNGDGTFGTKTDFPTGTSPTAIVTADFNADGHPDLAITNNTANTVSILLGSTNSDGTFGAKADFPTGNGPIALVTADFNGDTVPDLAVVNHVGNTVSFFPGNGDGTFGLRTDFITGNGPSAVAAADFNADGFFDLAVSNQTDNTVSVLIGNGNGTFGTQTVFATGNGPVAVVAGDFNIDGFQDLVVANKTDGTISLLLGMGNGSFQPGLPLTVGTNPESLVTADFNGDNLPDLAVADEGSNTVAVIINTAALNPGGSSLNPGQTAFPGAQYTDVGVKIHATPRVHNNGDVSLKLMFEIRSISSQSVNNIPIINNRTIEQTVRVKEGETSILSGILQKNDTRTLNGLPGLSDLPAIGAFLSNRGTTIQDTELLILVTPRLVRSASREDRSIYVGREPIEGGGGFRPGFPQERLPPNGRPIP